MSRLLPALVAWLLIALIGLASGLGLALAADVPVPSLEGRVMDLTGTLSPAAVQALDSKLAAFEAAKGSQIAVLIVPTTGPETIEQYGIRVADAWKLGRKGIDDGLLLLIAKDDRTVRIEVGYGLEGVVPDAVAKRVVDEVIVPAFKAGDFAAGINAGVDRLIALVNGESLPPPPARAATPADGGAGLFWLFVPIVVVGNVLRAMFGRLGGAALAGGAGFLAGWLLAGSIGLGLAIGLAAFLFVVIGFAGGVMGGRGGGWHSGGGGFSGGGFSGGGGGFGGGGASGRW